jgi:hypothetical protein
MRFGAFSMPSATYGGAYRAGTTHLFKSNAPCSVQRLFGGAFVFAEIKKTLSESGHFLQDIKTSTTK